MTYKDIDVKIMSNLPNDIWGDYERYPLMQDIDLKAKIYHMSPNILAKMYITDNVLDSETLAQYISSKYNRSWSRLWEAIELLEYKVDETDFKEINTVRNEMTEAFNTFNEGIQLARAMGTVDTLNTDLIMSGKELETKSNINTKNLTDKTSYNSRNTEDLDSSNKMKKNTRIKGSNTSNSSETEIGSGKSSEDLTYRDAGIGSGSLYKSKSEVTNANNSNSKTNKLNNKELNDHTTTGIDEDIIDSTRKNSHTGNDTKTLTGTDKNTESMAREFSNRKDSTVSKNIGQEDTNEKTDRSNQDEGMTLGEFNETVTSSGSSPLRTPQAMIIEEIGVRKIQYFDLIMEDVIKEICARHISSLN